MRTPEHLSNPGRFTGFNGDVFVHEGVADVGQGLTARARE